MSNPVPGYLARNIQQLRRALNLSQSALAEKAGIPRSTLTNLETGDSNPSLLNLLAVAGALSVNVEELLSRPRRALEHIPAAEIPEQWKANGKARILKLMPDKVRGLMIDALELDASATLAGHPHLKGTKEYLHVLEGELTVVIEGAPVAVKKGDVLAFEGDQPHAYRNTGSRKARALSVVVPIG
ncbi:MAG: helix-turn-helix domain-containing protein [Bdellovibrionota bacterium]